MDQTGHLYYSKQYFGHCVELGGVCYWPCPQVAFASHYYNPWKHFAFSSCFLCPRIITSIHHAYLQANISAQTPWLCPCAWKAKMASYCLWYQDLSLSSTIWCYYMPHLLRKLLWYDYHIGSCWGEKYYSCYKYASAPLMSFLLLLLQIAPATLRSPCL